MSGKIVRCSPQSFPAESPAPCCCGSGFISSPGSLRRWFRRSRSSGCVRPLGRCAWSCSMTMVRKSLQQPRSIAPCAHRSPRRHRRPSRLHASRCRAWLRRIHQVLLQRLRLPPACRPPGHLPRSPDASNASRLTGGCLPPVSRGSFVSFRFRSHREHHQNRSRCGCQSRFARAAWSAWSAWSDSSPVPFSPFSAFCPFARVACHGSGSRRRRRASATCCGHFDHPADFPADPDPDNDGRH